MREGLLQLPGSGRSHFAGQQGIEFLPSVPADSTAFAQQRPEDIIRFWLGHASSEITDRYSKLSEDVEFRRSVAASAGLGFEIPDASVVRSVRRNAVHAESGVAA
jgi:hypothetical protein